MCVYLISKYQVISAYKNLLNEIDKFTNLISDKIMQNSHKCLSLLREATQNFTIKNASYTKSLPVTIAGINGVMVSKGMHLSRCLQRNRNRKQEPTNLSALFKPVHVQRNVDEHDVGSELVGKLEKPAILRILNNFTQRHEIKTLCQEHGLDSKLFPIFSLIFILSI